MSLRINNNIAAINAHRNLSITTDALSSSMEKLSSGYRINSASDDPAGLVISEQFRAQIAGMNRAISNSEGSINMIQTAEGALNELNNLLVSMRELAIHAANEGFNDADQLAADQAEISNALQTIDRIAANTQFGTKKLLDGSKANTATITSANSSNLTILSSGLNTGTHSLAVTKVTDSTATLNTTSLGLSLAGTAGNPDNLNDGIHNIYVVQASGAATKTTGDIDITDTWGEGITIGAATAAAIVESSTAWDGLDAATTATVILSYQQNGEAAVLNKEFSITVASTDTLADVVTSFNALIAADDDLGGLVQASGLGGATLAFQTVGVGSLYSLNVESFTDTSGSVGTFAADSNSRGTSLNVLQFDIVTEGTGAGTATTDTVTVAAAAYTTMAALNTAINNALATAWGGASNTMKSEVVSGTNTLQFSTYDEGSDYSLKAVTNGTGDYQLEDIIQLTADTTAHTGVNAIVSFDDYRTDITSVKYASTSTLTVYDLEGDSSTLGRGSINLTIGTAADGGIDVGNLLLDVAAATYSVSLDSGPATAATAGINQLVYNADRSESIKILVDLRAETETHTIEDTDQSLVFQIGANVGQTAKIGVDNMSSSSLGRNIAGNMYANLSEIDVTTVAGAQDAQAVIDEAINQVSTLRGTLGSFQKNSLESNLRNLQIAQQNLTASESNIRDTDMAAEMSTFVKNQILLQAGTAMLAQANQVPQVVLSLFQ